MARRLLVEPEFAGLLERAGLRTAEDFVEGRLGRVLRADAYRENRVLELEGRRFYLKVFHYNALYITWWGIRRINMPSLDGVHELLAHRAFRAAGIATPRPVAAGFYRRGWFGRASFFLSLQVQGRPLDEVLAEGVPPAARRRLCQRVGELAALLHGHGWVHRDLYLCHLFVPSAAEPGALPLVVIDLQRARRRRSLRARVKDLAALHGSARGATRLERLRTLRHYPVLPRRPALLRRIERKARSLGLL